jgi:hypothetical protein
MSEKLLRYYQYVGDIKGFNGKMQLAIETKIPSTVAATMPDTPDAIQIFRQAVEKITGKQAPML